MRDWMEVRLEEISEAREVDMVLERWPSLAWCERRICR